ncbi:integrase [Brevundimonas sp. 1080]|uniref:site-specific integrase n=1 Tax=Brevundimonas sp. 1080 TaxID=3156405 RepID=UPI003391A2C4
MSAAGVGREHLEDEYEVLAMDGEALLEEEVAWAVERAERKHNLRIPEGSADRALVRAAFRTALVDQARGIDGMVREGDFFPSPTSELVRKAPPAVSPRRRWTVRHLKEHLIECTSLETSWKKKIGDAVAAWDNLGFGDLPVSEVTQKHIADYIRLLRKLPSNAAKRFPGIGHMGAIELNGIRTEPYPTLSEKTIFDGYVAGLKRIISHALDEGLISTDPVTRLPKKLTKSVSARDRIFQREELNALFKHPIFVGCAGADRPNSPGDVLLNDHYYWAPLLGLFTGARASEIAQLTVDRSLCQAQIPHLHIAPLPGGRLKSPNANRLIPLHQVLLDLGFGDFVEAQRAAGHIRLFPDWAASKNLAQQYSSARVIRNFNEEVVLSVVKRDLPPTFHTLRANFKTELATAGVSRQFQNAMLGHRQSDEDPSYLATFDLVSLRRELEKATFDGIAISHLHPSARQRAKS